MKNRLRIAIPVFTGKKMDNYFDVMARLGAETYIASEPIDIDETDGLLIPGGWDADPALYGRENAGSLNVNRALDDLQLAAIDAFVRAKKPILGNCRGHQMINVYFGGSLIQHLPESPVHCRDEGSTADKAHMTRAERGSFLCGLYGEEFATNSSHHQAVDDLGEGLEIVQRALDGVVEGIVHRSLPIWGVQWHPERMSFARRRSDTVDGRPVFEMFLKACAERRN